MFAPVKAKTGEEYIHNLEGDRKEAIVFLHDFIQKVDPSFTPNFLYNMLGYGSFKYIGANKKEIDWPTIGLASQKNYISLYVCSIADKQYLAEKYKDTLGKVKVGKSCITFKKLKDLDLNGLKELLKKAAKSPGLR